MKNFLAFLMNKRAVPRTMTLVMATAIIACSSSITQPEIKEVGDLVLGGPTLDGGLNSSTTPDSDSDSSVTLDTAPDTSLENADAPISKPITYVVSGFAQKGPFTNGTNVLIAECDNTLVPTGRTFMTSIVDNTGSFSLPNVQLSGKFIRLTADGFYFNEVSNQLSASRIALNAVADVTIRSTVNVNLLTHLEQPRLEYLLTQGLTFAEAKAQAQREVLAIFGFALSSPTSSETLDIARGTDGDSMLLAISTILQGQRTPGELTELLSNIGTDIRKDGILTSSGSGSALMNAAVLLNLTMVRSNLSRRYEALGMTALVGDFEKYVRAFINSKKYPFTDVISYPTTGASGPNLLDPSTTTFPFGHSGGGTISANLPRGTSLLVVLSLASGECMWGYTPGSCWKATTYDSNKNRQEFTIKSAETAQKCDVQFIFGIPSANVMPGSGACCIRLDYHENVEISGMTPTHTKLVCGKEGSTGDGGIPSPDLGIDAFTAEDAVSDVLGDVE